MVLCIVGIEYGLLGIGTHSVMIISICIGYCGSYVGGSLLSMQAKLQAEERPRPSSLELQGDFTTSSSLLAP